MELQGKKIGILIEEMFNTHEFWYPYFRLTVDYPEDLAMIRRIAMHFYPRYDFSLEEIVAFLSTNPEIANINRKYCEPSEPTFMESN